MVEMLEVCLFFIFFPACNFESSVKLNSENSTTTNFCTIFVDLAVEELKSVKLNVNKSWRKSIKLNVLMNCVQVYGQPVRNRATQNRVHPKMIIRQLRRVIPHTFNMIRRKLKSRLKLAERQRCFLAHRLKSNVRSKGD